MNTNLDPSRFGDKLSFAWFPSTEGADLSGGLARALAELKLTSVIFDRVESQVLGVLDRIGVSAFRRHYEIRRLSFSQFPELYELKFLIPLSTDTFRLRLYLVVDHRANLVVGLCFRKKRISIDRENTRELQNQDIAEALALAKQYFGGLALTEEQK